MVRQLADHIRELSHEIIDDIAEQGECDFVTDFAMHVPLIVIAELMGLDPAQRDELYRQSDAMMAGDATRPRRPGAGGGGRGGWPVRHHLPRRIIEARRADGTPTASSASSPTPSTRGALSPAGGGARAGRAQPRRAHVPDPAGGGRQRDHPQRPLRRAGRLHPLPRPAPQARRAPRADGPGRRRDRPLRQPSHVVHAHGDRGPHLSSRPAGRRPGLHALPVRQPRRGRVRRPRRVPHRPRPTPTSASASGPTSAWAPTWPAPIGVVFTELFSRLRDIRAVTDGPSTAATPAWCSPSTACPPCSRPSAAGSRRRRREPPHPTGAGTAGQRGRSSTPRSAW